MFESFRGIDDNHLLLDHKPKEMAMWFGRRFAEYGLVGIGVAILFVLGAWVYSLV